MKGKYAPLNPVAFGSDTACPGQSMTLLPVDSVVTGRNARLIASAMALWMADGDVVADATYGQGRWWKDLPGLPHLAFDALNGNDLRCLPLRDTSVDLLALDPPYRPTHGGTGDGLRDLAEAYGVRQDRQAPDTADELLRLYSDGISEAWRVLRPGGRLLVKCQDYSYWGRLHLFTLDVLRAAVAAGFGLADQFVLVSDDPIEARGRQRRARRAHSVLWVFVKE